MDALFDAACAGGFCETLGVWIAALLTFLVWSYLVRETLLFRVALSLLVGTASGFVSAVVIRTVIWNNALVPLLDDLVNLPERGLSLIIRALPVGLGVLLFLKLTPNWNTSTLSNLPLAYLFGVGAALAIGGALGGALVPQLAATLIPITGDSVERLNGLLIVLGTTGALLAFRFVKGDARGERTYELVLRVWGHVGRGFIMVAFGALLAGLIVARVSALVGQLYFLFHDWLPIIK